MNQYIYRIIPVRPDMVKESTPDEQRIIGEHFAYLQDLTQQGIALLVGRTTNNDFSTFGICVFLAEDDAAAQAILDNDPAVKQRVMRGELYPYRIALLHPGWTLPE
jgi:uncharacterized protein